MPTITDQAIVIRRWDFSETSQTVSLLTRSHGIVRGLAKGAKREKGDFSGGLDLLAEGQIVAAIKPGRELSTLTAWHLQNMHRTLHEDLAANRGALYMADLVHHLMIDQDPHPAVFDALSSSLALLDHSPTGVHEAVLRLQWCALCEAGYRPELHRDARSGVPLPTPSPFLLFNAAAGGLVVEDVQPNANENWRVRQETIDLLRDMARGSDIALRDREAMHRANRLLAAYAREIIGTEPSALRWAFPDLASPRV